MLIQCPPNQVKQEAAEERKFLKGVKEKQDVDMKQFLSQQKADYRGTKVIYKRVCCTSSRVLSTHYTILLGCILAGVQYVITLTTDKPSDCILCVRYV